MACRLACLASRYHGHRLPAFELASPRSGFLALSSARVDLLHPPFRHDHILQHVQPPPAGTPLNTASAFTKTVGGTTINYANWTTPSISTNFFFSGAGGVADPADLGVLGASDFNASFVGAMQKWASANGG